MMFSTGKFAVYGAVLGLTLTFLISSGVALGQGGTAGQSNLGYSGVPGASIPTRPIPTRSMMPP
jgi:hypothetical protein